MDSRSHTGRLSDRLQDSHRRPFVLGLRCDPASGSVETNLAELRQLLRSGWYVDAVLEGDVVPGDARAGQVACAVLTLCRCSGGDGAGEDGVGRTG